MQMTAPLAQASATEKATMISMVNEEIYRQQQSKRAAMTAAVERAKMVEHSRNELLARDLEARKAQLRKRPGIIERIREEIVECYAVTFGTIVVLGELFGLWEIEEA